MVNEKLQYTEDPEPWVHRWPNDRRGIRSANEKCSVAECKNTHEPRSLKELNKEKTQFWTKLREFWRQLGETMRR